MAEIVTITLTLSVNEAKAVHKALGQMSGTSYGNEVLAEAGSDVYSELSVIVEEEE